MLPASATDSLTKDIGCCLSQLVSEAVADEINLRFL